MAENPLLFHVENQVATLTINREKQRNSLTPQVIAQFMDCLDKAEADDQCSGAYGDRCRRQGILLRGRSWGCGIPRMAKHPLKHMPNY